MTLEEKRLAINLECEKYRGCHKDGIACPLYALDESCSADDAFVDRNYAILFGEPEADPVNKASHYNDGSIECIDALEASMTPIEYAGFLKGQVFKYLWRYRLKGKPAEDLKKARYYLDRLIQIVEKEATV